MQGGGTRRATCPSTNRNILHMMPSFIAFTESLRLSAEGIKSGSTSDCYGEKLFTEHMPC